MASEEKADPITLRINQLIGKLNLTKAEFALKIGVSQPVITHITTGRNKPGLEVIQRILAGYDTISADWLIAGQGSMFRKGSEKEKEALLQSVTALEEKLASSARELKGAAQMLEQLQKNIREL